MPLPALRRRAARRCSTSGKGEGHADASQPSPAEKSRCRLWPQDATQAAAPRPHPPLGPLCRQLQRLCAQDAAWRVSFRQQGRQRCVVIRAGQGFPILGCTIQLQHCHGPPRIGGRIKLPKSARGREEARRRVGKRVCKRSTTATANDCACCPNTPHLQGCLRPTRPARAASPPDGAACAPRPGHQACRHPSGPAAPSLQGCMGGSRRRIGPRQLWGRADKQGRQLQRRQQLCPPSGSPDGVGCCSTPNARMMLRRVSTGGAPLMPCAVRPPTRQAGAVPQRWHSIRPVYPGLVASLLAAAPPASLAVPLLAPSEQKIWPAPEAMPPA